MKLITRRRIVGEEVLSFLKEFAAMPALCAYPGCTETFKGNMPPGWHNLLIYSGEPEPHRTLLSIAESKRCLRDHVLCPAHSRIFELPKVDKRLEGLPGGPPLTKN
jgi:hypothetical protein